MPGWVCVVSLRDRRVDSCRQTQSQVETGAGAGMRGLLETLRPNGHTQANAAGDTATQQLMDV